MAAAFTACVGDDVRSSVTVDADGITSVNDFNSAISGIADDGTIVVTGDLTNKFQFIIDGIGMFEQANGNFIPGLDLTGTTGLTSITRSNLTPTGRSSTVKIASIVIPNSVTSIDKEAFSGLGQSLTSVTFSTTNGWKCDGADVPVTDPTANAKNLTDSNEPWYKTGLRRS